MSQNQKGSETAACVIEAHSKAISCSLLVPIAASSKRAVTQSAAAARGRGRTWHKVKDISSRDLEGLGGRRVPHAKAYALGHVLVGQHVLGAIHASHVAGLGHLGTHRPGAGRKGVAAGCTTAAVCALCDTVVRGARMLQAGQQQAPAMAARPRRTLTESVLAAAGSLAHHV